MGWANSFQTGLRCLASGQYDVAERRLSEATDEMRKESPNDLWGSLLANCLAVSAARRGDYAAGQEHYARSRQLWELGGFRAGDGPTSQALQWWEGLLTSAGLPTEAGLVARRRQNGQLPLLDPFEEVAPAPTPATSSASEWMGDGNVTPGLSLAPKPTMLSIPKPASNWPEALTDGLRHARQGRGPAAVDKLDEALDLARAQQDGGLRVSLSYNAMALALFLTGDYPGSDGAQAEATARWPHVARDLTPVEEYVTALRAAGLAAEAGLVEERRSAGQMPLLSPYQDLSSSGIARGSGPQTASFKPGEDWLPALREALADSAQGKGRDAVLKLSRLVEHLRPLAPGQLLRLCLTRGAVSLAAHLQGDYGLAEASYQEAVSDWNSLPEGQRDAPPVLQFVACLREAGLTEVHHLVSPRVGTGSPPLLNPFQDQVTTSTMAVVETPTVDQDPAAKMAPHQAYEYYMQEGLDLAGRKKFEQAQRVLVKAVERGKMQGGHSVRACLAMDAIAIVCQLAGDYGGAEKAYEDAVSLYKREKISPGEPSASQALKAFQEWLSISGLRNEARRLEEILARTRDGGKEPVLLCPWTDVTEPEIRKELPPEKQLAGTARGRRKKARSNVGLWVVLVLLVLGLGAGGYAMLRATPAPQLTDHATFGSLEVALSAKRAGPKVEFQLQVKNTATRPVKAPSGFSVAVRDEAKKEVWHDALAMKGELTVPVKGKKTLSLTWKEAPAQPMSAVVTYGSVTVEVGF